MTADDQAGEPVWAWLLMVDGAEMDLDQRLQQFGQAFRVPIPSARAREFAPGQRAVLVRLDRSRVIGLWAIGEVVAPALVRRPGSAVLEGEPRATVSSALRAYAEVDLFPLAKPVPLDSLLADPTLADGALGAIAEVTDRDREPIALTRRELRAIEATELWIEEPDEQQRAALDALLAREDVALEAEA